MKHQHLSTGVLLVLAVATGPTLASEDFCIKFQDIDGGTALAGCDPASSRGFEYHHLAARLMDAGVPQALQHQQIIVTKMADEADPLLWQRLDSGALITTVLVESPIGRAGVRFKFTLTNARILGIEPMIPHSQDPDNTTLGDQTRIRMDYQTLSIEYGTADPYVITP